MQQAEKNEVKVKLLILLFNIMQKYMLENKICDVYDEYGPNVFCQLPFAKTLEEWFYIAIEGGLSSDENSVDYIELAHYMELNLCGKFKMSLQEMYDQFKKNYS